MQELKIKKTAENFKYFSIKVITNSKQSKIINKEKEYLKVKLKSIPEKGKANKELIDLLAKEFNVKKNDFEIIKGKTSNTKIIKMIKR